MSTKIALCADEASVCNPELLGLAGERLESQSWLDIYSFGAEARSRISEAELLEEVWVASCEDVDAINLAATVKSDHPDLAVRLVDFTNDGSLLSRAHTASIDEVLDAVSFPRRYGEAKMRCSAREPVGGLAESRAGLEMLSPTTLVEESRGIARLEASEGAGLVLPQAQTLAVPAHRRGKALVMPIVSGSGGAGKSSVSVVSAFVSRDRGYRTLLLDYDLQFGDAAVLAGTPDALTIDEVLERPDLLERELGRGAPLTVLAAPSRIEMAEAAVESMPRLLDRLADEFEVIVANTGAAWAEQHAVLLERSATTLFLVDQRASSVRACQHALELCTRCGIATGPFRFAVNRCVKNAPLTAIDVSSALQGAPVLELRDGGRDVEDYLGSGSVEELIASKNEFCASVASALDELLFADEGVRASGEVRVEGLFSKRRGRHAGRKRTRRS